MIKLPQSKNYIKTKSILMTVN